MSLDAAYEKLAAFDPLTLPPAVRAAMVSQPLFVAPLRPGEAVFEAMCHRPSMIELVAGSRTPAAPR